MIAELVLAAIGGAGAALGIAAYLSRAFLKLQADKILARHTQALALEKDRLAHDLAIEFHQKSIAISRREQDRTEALKVLYAVIVELGAAVTKLRSLANIDKQKNFRAAYFTALSAIFTELSRTFNRIAEAHKAIELNAIYVDVSTEEQMQQMLVAVQRYYDQVLAKCNAVLAESQALGASLSEITQPKELVALCLEIEKNWVLIIEPSKVVLKNAVRHSLVA